MGIAARSAGEEPDADNAAGRGGEAQGAVVPANGFSGNSQVTVTVIEADGSSREILGEDVLSDAGGVLRHEAVLPDQIGGEYVLVEAVGLNDQGGVAYGNTFLEATTDAGCVAQAKLAGAVKEAGGQTPTDAASQNPTSGAVAASGGPGTPGTSPASALERTGASSAPVAGFGMVLVAAGFALCARRARGRLGRRTGQHARVTGA